MLKPEEAATKDRIQIDYDDAKDEIAVNLFFCIHQNSTCCAWRSDR